MSRVTGRTVIPTTKEEARVLEEMGMKTLRVPRRLNPYAVARRLKRAALPNPDEAYLKEVALRVQFVPPSAIPIVPTTPLGEPASAPQYGPIAPLEAQSHVAAE